MDNNDYKQFKVTKEVMLKNLYDQRCPVDEKRYSCLSRALSRDGLNDASVLWRMITNEVASFNAKIEAKITKTNNLNYSERWRESSLLNGSDLPHHKIAESVAKYPDKDWVDIYRACFM